MIFGLLSNPPVGGHARRSAGTLSPPSARSLDAHAAASLGESRMRAHARDDRHGRGKKVGDD
eukprot:4318835-Pyramimonas_sp.AAC.1